MNERIKQLAEQAGIYKLDLFDETDHWVLEKFAELIVKAVFDRIADERFEVYEPVVKSVKEHFGVEE